MGFIGIWYALNIAFNLQVSVWVMNVLITMLNV